MSWERLLRMLRIHSVPMPDLEPNPELRVARREVEQLHRRADRVLADYAEAETLRTRRRPR